MDGDASSRETSLNREEHHMTFRDRAVASQVLGVVLILGLLAVEPFSGRTFAEELNGVRLLEEMQNVFINLADRVKPAVVNISPVSVSAKAGESLRERGPNNPGTGSGVIGINTAIINYAQGIGFAIPSNMVQQVVNQLRSKGKVVRGWLGIGIQEVTPELAAKFGIKESDGILVNDVFENEPAARAGLKPGDIIAKVNGRRVETPSALSRSVAGLAT